VSDGSRRDGRREEELAYRASLGFIALKARSRWETIQYLLRRGFSDEAAAGAVKRLEDYGYLNDKAYARMLVESRTRLNPRGGAALRGELASKGVEESTAVAAVEAVDERDSARRAVEKGLYRWRGSDRKSFTRKVMAFLGRRGFSYEVANEACTEAWESLSGNLKTDE
jgi:regulatory protein